MKAADKMFSRTHTPAVPWRLVAADHKHAARVEVLEAVVKELAYFGNWIEKAASKLGARTLKQELGRRELR